MWESVPSVQCSRAHVLEMLVCCWGLPSNFFFLRPMYKANVLSVRWWINFLYLSFFLIWIVLLGIMNVLLTLSIWGLMLCPKAGLASAAGITIVEQADLDAALGMSLSQPGWWILPSSGENRIGLIILLIFEQTWISTWGHVTRALKQAVTTRPIWFVFTLSACHTVFNVHSILLSSPPISSIFSFLLEKEIWLSSMWLLFFSHIFFLLQDIKQRSSSPRVWVLLSASC